MYALAIIERLKNRYVADIVFNKGSRIRLWHNIKVMSQQSFTERQWHLPISKFLSFHNKNYNRAYHVSSFTSIIVCRLVRNFSIDDSV